mgnify:CR=1 FL=1
MGEATSHYCKNHAVSLLCDIFSKFVSLIGICVSVKRYSTVSFYNQRSIHLASQLFWCYFCRALHLAAHDGMVPVTQTLISKGASVFAVDSRGRYPALSCAANERIADCLELIISQMMSVSGGTPRASLGGRNSTGSTTAFINSTIGEAMI